MYVCMYVKKISEICYEVKKSKVKESVYNILFVNKWEETVLFLYTYTHALHLHILHMQKHIWKTKAIQVNK